MASSTPATPPLSVVIPSHGTRELTLACLAALDRGGDTRREVIVVDDASPDDSVSTIGTAFPAVRVLALPRQVGFTRAANTGLAAAGGDVLLLLNSDTEVDPGGLDRLLGAFASRPRLGVAGAALRYPDGRAQWSGGPAPTPRWLFVMASGLPAALAPLRRRWRRSRPIAAGVGWVSGAALALRRPVWETLGPLEERLGLYAQDLDLGVRAGEAGWEVAILPDFGVVHHHGASIGRQPDTSSRREHLARLWGDLATWARLRRDPRWAGRARRALLWGARLQAIWRTLALPLASAAQRAVARRDLAAVRHGVRALTDIPGDSPPSAASTPSSTSPLARHDP